MNRHADLENNITRVGIFVDVQDMYHAARSACNAKVDYTRLLEMLSEGHDVIVATAYLLFTKDVDFSRFKTSLVKSGFDTKEKFNETYIKDGNVDKTKTYRCAQNWEVGMTVDMIKWAPKVDSIILVSGNVKFLDAILYLKSQTRVVVAAFDKFTSIKQLKENCDEFINLCPKDGNDLGVLMSDRSGVTVDEMVEDEVKEFEDATTNKVSGEQ